MYCHDCDEVVETMATDETRDLGGEVCCQCGGCDLEEDEGGE